MSRCQHRFMNFSDGAPCTSEEHPANPNGHTYAADNVPDAHDASEHAAEASRG